MTLNSTSLEFAKALILIGMKGKSRGLENPGVV